MKNTDPLLAMDLTDFAAEKREYTMVLGLSTCACVIRCLLSTKWHFERMGFVYTGNQRERASERQLSERYISRSLICHSQPCFEWMTLLNNRKKWNDTEKIKWLGRHLSNRGDPLVFSFLSLTSRLWRDELCWPIFAVLPHVRWCFLILVAYQLFGPRSIGYGLN